MKILEILHDDLEELSEGFQRAYRRTGKHSMKLGVRCSSGQKAGKWVSDPAECNKRKDIKKVIAGRRIMRQKGAQIHHKAEITKRGAFSHIVARVNARLSGKSIKTVAPKDIKVVQK